MTRYYPNPRPHKKNGQKAVFYMARPAGLEVAESAPRFFYAARKNRLAPTHNAHLGFTAFTARFDRVRALPVAQKKRPKGRFFIWRARQDSNLQPLA